MTDEERRLEPPVDFNKMGKRLTEVLARLAFMRAREKKAWKAYCDTDCHDKMLRRAYHAVCEEHVALRHERDYLESYCTSAPDFTNADTSGAIERWVAAHDYQDRVCRGEIKPPERSR